MQPENYTISYYQGDSFSLILYPKAKGDVPINLDGVTPYFKIANKRGADSTIRIVGGASIGTPNGGQKAIIASLTADQGRNVGNGYVYDISYENSTDGSVVTVLTGVFSVIQEVVAP